jgi:hypothetical protein
MQWLCLRILQQEPRICFWIWQPMHDIKTGINHHCTMEGVKPISVEKHSTVRTWSSASRSRMPCRLLNLVIRTHQWFAYAKCMGWYSDRWFGKFSWFAYGFAALDLQSWELRLTAFHWQKVWIIFATTLHKDDSTNHSPKWNTFHFAVHVLNTCLTFKAHCGSRKKYNVPPPSNSQVTPLSNHSRLNCSWTSVCFNHFAPGATCDLHISFQKNPFALLRVSHASWKYGPGGTTYGSSSWSSIKIFNRKYANHNLWSWDCYK